MITPHDRPAALRARDVISNKSAGREASGNAVLMLLPIVLFMLIFGYSLIMRSTSEHTQSFHVHRQNVVTYLAEGALNIAMQHVAENLEKKYKKLLIDNALGVYNIADKAPEVKNAVKFLFDAMPGAELTKLTMDFADAVKFDKLQRDPNEKIGLLIFTCGVKYYDVSTTLKIVRDIKIVNMTPPAEEFTLYTNTPNESDHIINTGPSIFCKNRDEDNGALGSIRIAGGEKGNIFYLGEKYGWPDQTISPLPAPTRSEVYAKYGLYKPGQLLDAVSDLPKPLISAFQSSLEIELSEFAVNSSGEKKKYSCIISVGSPILDLPREVFGGVVYGSENNKAKQAYGKGGLFGYPTIANIKSGKLYLPKKLYGKGLKKLYGRYTLSEKVISIPVSVDPPKNVQVYVYYYGPKEAEKITQPYSSADGSFAVTDSDGEGRIGLDGCAAMKGEEYKKRAIFCTEEITMKTMQLFSGGGSLLINGVLFGKKVHIGAEKQTFVYNGRCIIASDGEMTIYDNVLINDKLAPKIPTSLSLILYPKGASDANLAVAPIKYRARKISVEGEKTLVLKLDANVFSFNGMEYDKGNATGGPSSGLTRLYIFGNYAVNRLIKKDFSPWLFISYKKRLVEKDYGQYVVSMSPIYSAFYEDKRGAKQ